MSVFLLAITQLLIIKNSKRYSLLFKHENRSFQVVSLLRRGVVNFVRRKVVNLLRRGVVNFTGSCTLAIDTTSQLPNSFAKLRDRLKELPVAEK